MRREHMSHMNYETINVRCLVEVKQRMKHFKSWKRKSTGHSRILINEKKFWPAVQVFGESPPTREPARRDFAASDYWIVIFIEYYSNTAPERLIS